MFLYLYMPINNKHKYMETAEKCIIRYKEREEKRLREDKLCQVKQKEKWLDVVQSLVQSFHKHSITLYRVSHSLSLSVSLFVYLSLTLND